MEPLTIAERLQMVKTASGHGGDYADDLLQIYIDEAIDVLVDGGVKQDVALSKAAIGSIVIFVNDNWNYDAGGVVYSDAFTKRLIQLAAKE